LTKYHIEGNESIKRLAPFSPGHKLVEFVPDTPLDPEDVIGRKIEYFSRYCGTYGMGGAGYMGFALDFPNKEDRFLHHMGFNDNVWLIIAAWGADTHCLYNNMPMGGSLELNTVTKLIPESSHCDPMTELLVGKRIKDIIINENSMRMIMSDDGVLEIPEDIKRMPFGVNEKQNKIMEGDLRKIVFLAPTCVLWV